MPAPRNRSARRLIAAALALSAAPALAQDAADISLVITRDVEPRIAYRGIPLQDHPIGASVVVFPGAAFESVIERQLSPIADALVGENELSVIAASGALPALGGAPQASLPLALDAARIGGGLAPTATRSVGSSLLGATRELGTLVTGALTPLRAGGTR